jgi:Mg/Co/Ni transporter MgtE
MTVYVVLVYVVGFALATIIYMASMAWLMGYKRHWITAATAIILTLCIVAFAALVGILLPTGLLGQ